MAALTAIFVCIAYFIAYKIYARFLGNRIYEEHENIVTPAHAMRDGVDYVPAPRAVLYGHHFTSIAGAAPIIGPSIAAYWGWGPSLAWVVLGTIFIGAVHDFGALVVSVREKGVSIAEVTAQTIGPRARILFMCFILILSWLLIAVFAMAVADLFVSQPESVIPINIQIVVALFIGWFVYKRQSKLLIPSLISLAILYAFIFVGTEHPVDLVAMGYDPHTARTIWLCFLFFYSAIASLLPVWLLLQPRDYINSHQLLVGLGLLFIGLLIAHPNFDAPFYRPSQEGEPPIFPILFVTIACGAISGFHGLVASGTTSKQLDKLSDARLVGYGSMLSEGGLALIATLAAVSGIALVGGPSVLPSQGIVDKLSWATYYETWAHTGVNKATSFVLGGGAFLEAVGLPQEIARTLMAVLVIAFAATSLDTATRIQRFILAEFGKATHFKPLTNPYIATLCAIIPAMYLTLAQAPNPSTGTPTYLGWVLWPIFGSSNQLLAAFTLMTLSLYFFIKKKPILPLVIPTIFVSSISALALMASLKNFIAQENTTLAILSALMLVLMVWMLVEGSIAVRKALAQT